jgi:hypothetical protein
MPGTNSQDTLLQQKKNRLLAAFYGANPNARLPNNSQQVYLEIKAGRIPVRSITAGGDLVITEPCGCVPPVNGGLLRSKNNTTDGGFTIGTEPDKDMDNNDYTAEFNPNNYQAEFFPSMADFIDENIVAGDKALDDRLTASYWDDLGNDIFDDWGYFYIYDVGSGKYYFPLFNPQNESDGTISTQTFNAFGRTFTISHGWAVEGIFKFDISVDDALPFRFGAYGNMGSDGDEITENLTYAYTVDSTPLTLYYHHHQEDGDSDEQLYSYWVPKRVSEGAAQTYAVYYDGDDMSMKSNEVTSGLIVYFAKENDVKEWVANDLEIVA